MYMRFRSRRRYCLALASIAILPFMVCPSFSFAKARAPFSNAAGIYDIRNYGAIGDGLTDSTSAIQNAIDAASIKGGIVLIPIGRFLCKGNLEIKMGVHLKGLNEVPQSWEPQTGSILMPTADKNNDNEDAPGFIEMRTSTSRQPVASERSRV